jgi:purine-nucleoside phosphorylase
MSSGSPAFRALAAAAWEAAPEAAVVLGSGLGGAALRLRRPQTVQFGEVPGMLDASVRGHAGRLALGEWAGRRVLVFEGRLHYYEGHPWRTVCFPVHVAAQLGARCLVLANAAGGIHPALAPGSLMVIRDHIDWTRPCFWRQPRASPYSPRLATALIGEARTLGMVLHEGIYAAVTGPSYETPAEIRALRLSGADAVGMSTAREADAGHDLGIECAAVSCITNRAAGLAPGPLVHEEVLASAAAQAERLADLLEYFLGALSAINR